MSFFSECLFGCRSSATRCSCLEKPGGLKDQIRRWIPHELILTYLRWCGRCQRELTDAEGACWSCLRYLPLQNLRTPKRVLCSPDRIQPSIDPRDEKEPAHGALLRFSPFPEPLLPLFAWQNQCENVRPDFLTVYCPRALSGAAQASSIVLNVFNRMMWTVHCFFT